MRRGTLYLCVAVLLGATWSLGCSKSSSRSGAVLSSGPPPVPLSITSVLPTRGPTAGGTTVTILGTGFQTGASVLVGGNLASSVVLSPTAISLATPASPAGAANVTVTNTNGETVTAVGAFMFGTPAPTVAAVSPSSGALAGGTLITITGSGFESTGTTQPTVMIGGAACTNVQTRTAATLTCLTGASGSAGQFTVTLTNPDTQSGGLPNGFTYVGDTTPPTFAGLQTALPVSPYQVELTWLPATDDSTTSALISYTVHVATTSGAQNFTTPSFVTGAGVTRFTVGGLSPGTAYWFVVRARDLSGNSDTNTIERSAITAAAPTPSWGTPGALAVARADCSVSVLSDGRVVAAGGRDASGSLSSSEIYDPGTGTWTSTAGGIGAPREQHAAVVLADGRILIVGGYDSTLTPTPGAVATAMLYDPTTGTWSATGNALGAARQRCSATLLSSGQVLVVGGVNGGGPVGTSELYDPTTNTWTGTTGAPGTGRDWHSAVLLASGDVLVAGGGTSIGITGTAEIYNPGTGTWQSTGTMGTARLAFGLTRLRDGRVLAAGGLIGASFTANCELWSPTNGTWVSTGALSTARGLHTTVLLPNGQVHAAGGGNNSVELYNPANGAWTSGLGFQTARDSHRAALLHSGAVLLVGGQNVGGPTASVELETTSASSFIAAGSLVSGRGRHTSVTMGDGRILAAGGYVGNNTIGLTALRTSELYDPTADTWTATPNMLQARWGNTMTLLPDGRVLVTGGTSTGSNTLGAEMYDPTIGTWTGVTSPGTNRQNHAGALLRDGRVLICGGWDGVNMWSTAEIYDPSASTWTATGTMFGWRGWHSATRLLDGRILIAGGWSGFGSMNNAEVFNPATGSWSTAGTFNTSRYGHTATLLPDGRVVIVGGINQPTGSSTSNNVTDVDIYDPNTNTWSAATALPAATAGHTATLLPSGKLLVAGGFVQPQLYDPAINTWWTQPNVLASRFVHTGHLLPDGRVLLVGGRDQTGSTFTSCERYEPGLGFADAWRPAISAVGGSSAWPVDIAVASSITITGVNLRGPLEGNSGGVADVAASVPIVQLCGPLGASTGYLDGSPARRYLTFNATFALDGSSVTFTTPAAANIDRGYYQLRIIANGIPSESVTVRVP